MLHVFPLFGSPVPCTFYVHLLWPVDLVHWHSLLHLAAKSVGFLKGYCSRLSGLDTANANAVFLNAREALVPLDPLSSHDWVTLHVLRF